MCHTEIFTREEAAAVFDCADGDHCFWQRCPVKGCHCRIRTCQACCEGCWARIPAPTRAEIWARWNNKTNRRWLALAQSQSAEFLALVKAALEQLNGTVP
jgi:hypothetical protein